MEVGSSWGWPSLWELKVNTSKVREVKGAKPMIAAGNNRVVGCKSEEILRYIVEQTRRRYTPVEETRRTLAQ